MSISRRVCGLLLLTLPAMGQTFTNPIFKNADPWVTFDKGTYYYSFGCKQTSICVKASNTLLGIAAAESTEIWKAPPTGPNRAEIWAPEIHKVDGHWYVYYCADAGGNDTHRLFIISAATDDPLGDYVMADTGGPQGGIVESSGNWAIDPDIFTGPNRKLYLTWSCTNSGKSTFPQDICLARMKDALHVDGETVQISKPTEDWELRGGAINEGPVGFVRNGKTFVTYSGSASFAANTYSVGLLTNASGDLMRPAAWVKTGPIFDRHDKAFGTGSVVFVQSPEGGVWWNVYHGIDRMDCTPSPYACRDIRMQPMWWAADGSPLLGYPYDPGVPIPLAGESGTKAGDWGPSFGDAAEGKATSGAVRGEWEEGERGTIASKTMGAGTNQTFRWSNPNLPSFTVSAEMKWQESGTTAAHRYGLYAAYLDAGNFVAYAIDPDAKTLVSLVNASGNSLPPLSCPIPLAEDFKPEEFHTIKVAKAGVQFNATVDGVAPKGPCNGRTLYFENGQTGLITQDARATFRHFDIIAPELPTPRPAPVPPRAAPPAN